MGRRKIYDSNADRQCAWRDRQRRAREARVISDSQIKVMRVRVATARFVEAWPLILAEAERCGVGLSKSLIACRPELLRDYLHRACSDLSPGD